MNNRYCACGCNPSPGSTTVNLKGRLYAPTYVSAYGIALEHGFQGTEEEWLDSLIGDSAYEIAVQQGFEGTEEEWIQSLIGPEGPQGPDGKSAYEIAVEHGFDGTIEEWLESLNGVSDHSELTGTDAPDCHPISAISGLEDSLQVINSEMDGKLDEVPTMSEQDIEDICVVD